MNDAITRSNALERILNDPHFKAVIEEIRQDFISAWIKSGPFDYDERERAKLMVDALALIEKRMAKDIQTGEIEKSRLGLRNIFGNK